MILREIIDDTVCTSVDEPDFKEQYDLVVVGLGTAGAISLITAGREGLSVLGVEQLYGMGGTGTTGSVCYYYFGAIGGVYTEIDEKAAAMRKEFFGLNNIRDTKAFILNREAKACGANIKYNCIVTGVYLEGNKVVGLRLFQNGRTTSVKAEKFIDATGEAIVCHLAGCESNFGRAFDKQTQPATSVSILMRKDGRTRSTNKDAGFVDQRNPRDVSRVIVNSNNFPMYLKDDYEKEEDKFIAVAPLFGVREGRLINGKKVLTMKTAISSYESEKEPLFYTFCNLDNHGKDIAFENEDLCDWMVAAGLWGVLMSVPISKEVLIPEKLENIMVAGRCLSVDHNMAAGIRAQRDMAKSGEAAAYVCCEAIKRNVPLSEVNYSDLKEKLKSSNCLDDANSVGFMERVANQYYGNPLPLLKTPAEILSGLSGEKPGWAIWAARECAERQQLVELLKEHLWVEDENLARNVALALGIMGETAALGALRKMAAEPDNFVPKSSLKYIYTRGVSAIYLLGKLGDAESIDMLFGILERRGQCTLAGFEFGEFYNEGTDVYSQYILFAARALADIAKLNPDRRTEVKARLLNMLEEEEYHIMITLRDNSASLHDLKPKLLEYVKMAL